MKFNASKAFVRWVEDIVKVRVHNEYGSIFKFRGDTEDFKHAIFACALIIDSHLDSE